MNLRHAILSVLILGSLLVLGSCSDSDDCASCPDTGAPKGIDNLATGLPNYNSVTISWTAPDSAIEYDIRYSTAMIDAANFGSASEVADEPTPQNPGATEIFRVTHLNESTDYYIAIKFRTGPSSWSTVSNVATCYTSTFDSRGKIVFISQPPDQPASELVMINSDGTDLQRLTYDLAWDHTADFSFDGRYVFFVSYRTDTKFLNHVMDLVADTVSPVYTNTIGDNEMRCADSVPILTFIDNEVTGNVYTMSYDGSNRAPRTFFTDTTALWPAISADGLKIVFSGVDLPEAYTFTVDAAGTNLVKIKDDAVSNPDWSPDGTRIAYYIGAVSDIWVMNADGTADINMTNNADADDRDPRWSPDGSRIVFASDRDGDYEIYIMDSDGSNVVQLTDNDYDDFIPAWSPVR